MRSSKRSTRKGKRVVSVRPHFRYFPLCLYAGTFLLLLGVFIIVAASPAQVSSRRVIARSAPTYPELAKKTHLSGKVQIEVEVNPGGSVISAKMVGGSLVFEHSAIEAVKQWKFESAQNATKGVITVEFAEP
jgi:TonB family protein